MKELRDVFVRSSQYLALRLKEGNYIGQNPMVGSERILPLPIVAMLASIRDYISAEKIASDLQKQIPTTALAEAAVIELIGVGLLVEQGTTLDGEEEGFKEWVWSREAAMHFLATRRVRWMDEVAEVEVFGRLLQKQEMPALWDDISGTLTPGKPSMWTFAFETRTAFWGSAEASDNFRIQR
jgi:hypothetical protein